MYSLNHAVAFFDVLCPSGVCRGNRKTVPAGARVKILRQAARRALCQTSYQGQYLWGWIDRDSLTAAEEIRP